MEKKYKILIGVGVILFVCLVTWVIRTTPKAPPQEDKIDPPTVMEYEGNVISEEKNGTKVWELTADKMLMDSVTQTAEIENIHGKFFQEDGKVLEISGKTGTYNQQTKDVHVEGDVVVYDGEGTKLTGDNLDWTGSDETITATKNVKIFREDVRAFGEFASSKDGFRHFFMKGNVRILKGVKDDDFAKEMEERAAKVAEEENLTDTDKTNTADKDKNNGV